MPQLKWRVNRLIIIFGLMETPWLESLLSIQGFVLSSKSAPAGGMPPGAMGGGMGGMEGMD